MRLEQLHVAVYLSNIFFFFIHSINFYRVKSILFIQYLLTEYINYMYTLRKNERLNGGWAIITTEQPQIRSKSKQLDSRW